MNSRLIVSTICITFVLAISIDTLAADRNVTRERMASSKPKSPIAPANPQVLQTRDLATGLTLDSIIAALVGTSSIAISNVQFTGSDSALGIFTGGTGIIGFERGIVLSSGLVENVVGPNENDGASFPFGRLGDADLDSLLPDFQTTQDACILEFDFECPAVREIGFEYVFSSEEYNEFVFLFNDMFGFFVNGENIALLPDGKTVVSINTVNHGNPTVFPDSVARNPEYHINNGECQPSCQINTEMDGLTVVLIAEAKIQPGPNHIKLAIADVGDQNLDSDVFLKGQSFVCGAVNNNAPTCEIDPSGPFNVTVGSNLAFTVSGSDPDDGQAIYMYAVGNLPPGAVMNPSLPRAGSQTGMSSQFTWTPTQAGVYTAAFFVTDSLGGADTASVQLTVSQPQVNNPPICVIDPAGPFNLNVGSDLTFTVTGSDPNDGQSIYMYALGNLPPGAVMNPSLPLAGSRTGLSSQFSWTPTQAGVYTAAFFVTDSLGGADTASVQITVSSVQINVPPVCVIDPIGPFTVRAGTNLSFTVTGADGNDGQTITLNPFGAIPTGATMTPPLPLTGPNTGISSQFSWTPTSPGNHFIGFILQDNSGAKDTITTIIAVLESTPPFVVSVSPSNGVTEVPWDARVIIEFSEPVINTCDILTAPLPCVLVQSNNSGALPVTESWNGVILSLLPSEQWPDDDTITVVLSGELEDAAGNSLDGDSDGIPEGSPVDDYRFWFFTTAGVYPGDANDDGTVDERDVLPLGVHYLRTGQQRLRNPDIWTLERAFAWSPFAATHADCDGNGIIDSLDICTILEFFDRAVSSKRGISSQTVEALTALDDPVRASLLNALLDCEVGSAAAHTTLIHALQGQTETEAPLPSSFTLEQNYPNPFNAGTVISWQMTSPAYVDLSIFDILGKRVRKVIDRDMPAAFHSVNWDGTNDDGQAVASGVYMYRLIVGHHSAARSMVLIR